MSLRETLWRAANAVRTEVHRVRVRERLEAPVEPQVAPALPAPAAIEAPPEVALVSTNEPEPVIEVETCWTCEAPPATGLVMCQACIDTCASATVQKAKTTPRKSCAKRRPKAKGAA